MSPAPKNASSPPSCSRRWSATVDVARQIQHNLEAKDVSLGPAVLKNVRLSVEICRIVLPWGEHSQERGCLHPRELVRCSYLAEVALFVRQEA